MRVKFTDEPKLHLGFKAILGSRQIVGWFIGRCWRLMPSWDAPTYEVRGGENDEQGVRRYASDILHNLA